MERYVDAGIYRGARADLLRQVARMPLGVKSVLSLQRWELDELPDGVQACTLPLGVLCCPGESELRAALLLIEALPRPVYIHCKSGVDRTGAVVAYYRVLRQGISPEKAIQEMLSRGFHRRRYFYWLPKLRRILRIAQVARQGGRTSVY